MPDGAYRGARIKREENWFQNVPLWYDGVLLKGMCYIYNINVLHGNLQDDKQRWKPLVQWKHETSKRNKQVQNDKRSIDHETINILRWWCTRRRNLGCLVPVAPQFGDRELEAGLDRRRYQPSGRSCRKCAPRHEIHPCRRGSWPLECYHLVPSRCTGRTRCFLRKGTAADERKPRNQLLNL